MFVLDQPTPNEAVIAYVPDVGRLVDARNLTLHGDVLDALVDVLVTLMDAPILEGERDQP